MPLKKKEPLALNVQPPAEDLSPEQKMVAAQALEKFSASTESPNLPATMLLKVTEAEFQKIADALDYDAAENDGEESELLYRLRLQRAVQVGDMDNVNAKCCTVGCRTDEMWIHTDFLKGKWVEGSINYFCPFCDPECRRPMCRECKDAHLKKEIYGQ